MVHVGIHHDGFLDRAVRLQPSNGHGHVVDGAKPLAMFGIGMMKSAAEIRTESVAQRRLRSQDGSARRQPNGFHQFRRIRNFQTHDVAGRECAGFQFAHPVRRVHTQDVFIAGRVGSQKIRLCREAFAQEHLVNQPEFLRRKYVCAKVQVVAVMINKLEWKKGLHLDQIRNVFSRTLNLELSDAP